MPNLTNLTFIDNLLLAKAVLDEADEAELDLAHFRVTVNCRTHCQTLYCAAGWLASSPLFQAKGMILTPYNIDRWLLVNKFTGRLYDYDFLDNLFGPEAFGRLFPEYGKGAFDRDILGEDFVDAYYVWLEAQEMEPPIKPMTDKALALARFDRQLQELGWVAPASASIV